MRLIAPTNLKRQFFRAFVLPPYFVLLSFCSTPSCILRCTVHFKIQVKTVIKFNLVYTYFVYPFGRRLPKGNKIIIYFHNRNRERLERLSTRTPLTKYIHEQWWLHLSWIFNVILICNINAFQDSRVLITTLLYYNNKIIYTHIVCMLSRPYIYRCKLPVLGHK